MSRPSSAMQVATSTLNAPSQKSCSTAFCSFCFMPGAEPLSPLPGPCPMNALQAIPRSEQCAALSRASHVFSFTPTRCHMHTCCLFTSLTSRHRDQCCRDKRKPKSA